MNGVGKEIMIAMFTGQFCDTQIRCDNNNNNNNNYNKIIIIIIIIILIIIIINEFV